MYASFSMCPPLAVCLRESTQQAHTLTENTPFMKCALKGMVTRESVRRLMASLYFVYTALELELYNQAHHPVVGALCVPRLERMQPLEQDLEFYYGANWREQMQPSRQTLRYVMRIHAIANDEPALLAAHAYVRYMGDLSGGQGLKAIIRSALNLPEGVGTAFYDFQGLPTAKTRLAFKERYRNILNGLPLTEVLGSQILAEAKVAFELNQAILQELTPLLKKELGKERLEHLMQQPNPGSTARAQGKKGLNQSSVPASKDQALKDPASKDQASKDQISNSSPELVNSH